LFSPVLLNNPAVFCHLRHPSERMIQTVKPWVIFVLPWVIFVLPWDNKIKHGVAWKFSREFYNNACYCCRICVFLQPKTERKTIFLWLKLPNRKLLTN
jgi:hypothetical protein